MGWVRIDDDFFFHRKVIEISKDAKLLFIAALCHCAAQMTDGFVSKATAANLARFIGVKSSAAKELVDHELWHKREDGYDVHDYLEYQPTAESERTRRKAHADRVAVWRERKKAKRDGGGDTTSDGVRDASRDWGGDSVRDGPVTLSPNPNPLSTHSRSDLHDVAPGAVNDEVRTEDDELQALLDWWLVAVPEQRRTTKLRVESVRVITYLRAHLDDRFIETIIGTCHGLESPPGTAAYLLSTAVDHAARAGITIPEMGA